MKIITAPTVELLARQTFEWGNLTGWLAANGLEITAGVGEGATSGGEVVAEASGRVCYLSYSNPRPGGNAAYLEHIKEVGHGSVLEHAVYTFLISGVSRALTHELVRHRVGVAYSQLSQRYVDESQAEYVVPKIIESDPELFAIWRGCVSGAHAGYIALADALNSKLLQPDWAARWLTREQAKNTTERRKAARQAARSVLPNATETKLSFTANARALRHLFDMRAKVEAEPEIRVLALSIWRKAVAESPNLFGDYREEPLPDGTAALYTDYPNV